MKLKTFSPDNTPQRILPDPAISITKAGRIGFNSLASEELRLEEGSNILFHQDENGDWYIQSTMAKGFKPLRHGDKSGFYIQSKYLSIEIKSGKEEAMVFLIGKQFEANGMALYPLLKQ